MWTLHYMKEIPVDNVIHMTDISMRQTHQNTSSFFRHTSKSKFITDFVCRFRKSNLDHSTSVNRVNICKYVCIFSNTCEGKVCENKRKNVTEHYASICRVPQKVLQFDKPSNNNLPFYCSKSFRFYLFIHRLRF